MRHWFSTRRNSGGTLGLLGYRPVTFQGWVVLILYATAVVTNFMRIDSDSHSASDTLINFIPETIVMTALLVILCHLASDTPRFRIPMPGRWRKN